MASRTEMSRARPDAAAFDVDWKRHGRGRWSGSDDGDHEHDGQGLHPGDPRPYNRCSPACWSGEDSLSCTCDWTNCVRPRVANSRWSCRCRQPHNERGRPVHPGGNRDQRSLYVLLRASGYLNMALARPHITVDDLRVGWGTRVLMEHVTFDVKRGSVFAILGGSGSGKSTLLRHLIGLERPQAGRINIEGVGEPQYHEGAPPFGVLFQSGALFSSMTLAKNLALPLTTWTPLRGPIVRELVQAKLELVGLGPFAEHLPGEISGGMKKRAGIARALMLEADLLFFDEPSAGLDPISAVELDQLILTLSRDLGITVVIVTHELPSIFLVAGDCIVLDKAAKGIVARGDPRKLRDESKIPFVHNFFTRSSPGASTDQGG